MIHLAFFLYYFAQKILQKAILFGGNLIKLVFLLIFNLEILVVNGALILKAPSSLHGLCLLFSFLKKQKTKFQHWITKNLTDFIIAVTGISIKSELAGVVHLWTYSCFESLKVRDFRLEPMPRYSFYKRIRKDSQ